MKRVLNIKNYHPANAPARAWSEIENNYIDLIQNHGWEIEPMLDLVRHIISTGLSDRLFAFTSHHMLRISIYNPVEVDRETLHIDFEQREQKWYFSYYPKPGEPVEFERKYEANMGIEKFDQVIRILKW